jgi:hypothetical protein
VDAGLHQLQGETEGVRPSEQLALHQEFYRDRLAVLVRHVEGAKLVSDYESNNTYQYIIAREEVHLQWVRDAIQSLGGEVPTQITPLPVPKGGKSLESQIAVIDDDARQAREFVAGWTKRVEPLTNARHRSMLKVILGEVLEHKRFFEQAKAGRDDLLGRRPPGASTGDGVLRTRWME